MKQPGPRAYESGAVLVVVFSDQGQIQTKSLVLQYWTYSLEGLQPKASAISTGNELHQLIDIAKGTCSQQRQRDYENL